MYYLYRKTKYCKLTNHKGDGKERTASAPLPLPLDTGHEAERRKNEKKKRRKMKEKGDVTNPSNKNRRKVHQQESQSARWSMVPLLPAHHISCE